MLYGQRGMPPLGRMMSDTQVADVANYVRTHFGNQYGDAVAPELAYVMARYAPLAPFGKVAALLSELLPFGGAQHASTVRNRTLRGEHAKLWGVGSIR